MSNRAILTSNLAFVALLAASPAAAAISSPDCTTSTAAGAVCQLRIEELHPTQLTYGEIEVQRRADKFQAMPRSELGRYVANNPVLLVIGPQEIFYVTDHHHMAMALGQVLGKGALIEASVVANWSSLSASTFWRQMQDAGYIYLYDEHGAGPQPLTSLPLSLSSLVDDPYRSLAWGVRKDGGYNDTTVPHADFLWANFFRTRVSESDITSHFDAAALRGKSLAMSPSARGLPGYKGN